MPPYAFHDAEDLLDGITFSGMEGILGDEQQYGSIFSPVRTAEASPKLGHMLGQNTYTSYQYNPLLGSPFNMKGSLSPGFVRRSTRLTPGGQTSMTPNYMAFSISPSPFKLPFTADMGMMSPRDIWMRQAAPQHHSHAKRPLLPPHESDHAMCMTTPSPLKISDMSPGADMSVNKQGRIKKEKRMFKKERKNHITISAPKRGEYRCGKCGHFPKKAKHVCNKASHGGELCSPESAASLNSSLETCSPDAATPSQESRSDSQQLPVPSQILGEALGLEPIAPVVTWA